MDDVLRPIYQERASQENTLGILQIEKFFYQETLTDTFDIVLLVIVKEQQEPSFIKHYQIKNQKAALHIVTEGQIREWMLLGTNRKIIGWIHEGKILFDRNDYVIQLKNELRDFPSKERKIKMGLEFAKLIRRYYDGKALFDANQFLDAYNHVVHSLHHLARLAIIESGFHSELTVWNQVKHIEPEIYKLYVELINSTEAIEKRLELLFIASDFLIRSRAKIGANHIIDILRNREQWSINDIASNNELKCYGVDLTILLEYLIDTGFIKIVEVHTKGQGVYHRYYQVK